MNLADEELRHQEMLIVVRFPAWSDCSRVGRTAHHMLSRGGRKRMYLTILLYRKRWVISMLGYSMKMARLPKWNDSDRPR